MMRYRLIALTPLCVALSSMAFAADEPQITVSKPTSRTASTNDGVPLITLSRPDDKRLFRNKTDTPKSAITREGADLPPMPTQIQAASNTKARTASQKPAIMAKATTTTKPQTSAHARPVAKKDSAPHKKEPVVVATRKAKSTAKPAPVIVHNHAVNKPKTEEANKIAAVTAATAAAVAKGTPILKEQVNMASSEPFASPEENLAILQEATSAPAAIHNHLAVQQTEHVNRMTSNSAGEPATHAQAHKNTAPNDQNSGSGALVWIFLIASCLCGWQLYKRLKQNSSDTNKTQQLLSGQFKWHD